VVYRCNFNIIGLFTLEAIGLTFTEKNNVLIRLEVKSAIGNKGDVYEWDLLDSNTPGMVNTQNKFKLSYLALAQNFCDRDGELKKMDSITDAVDFLSKNADKMVYDSGTNWLFSTDFTINDVFRARAILLDPHLYGIAITVIGKKPLFSSFDGLLLELLYKKVAPKVGMFRATLVLPHKFRRFTIGYATIIIGRMSIEIYTNGDFKIDMGFPHNRDFSQSFALEFGIFSGAGGFYFELLSGITYPSLPSVSCGYYAPVITLGIGLSFGIGRSFDIGIVSAGFSLQAVGIFEGVIAFFNEDSNAISIDGTESCFDVTSANGTYFKAKATLGLTGRVHVKVNLYIITITASVEFRAFAQVQYETGKSVFINFSLELTLRASIRILFVKVSFEYRLNLKTQIEIKPKNNYLLPPCANNLCCYIAENKNNLNLDILPYFSMREAATGHEHVLAFLPILEQNDFVKLIKLLTDWVTVSNESGDIDYETITNFLTDNVTINLIIRSTSDAGNDVSGVVFAMPAPLELRLVNDDETELLHREYWSHNPVSIGYIEQLRQYFNTFDLDDSPEMQLALNSETPIAEVIFTDYFNMLIRHITKSVKRNYNKVNTDELAAMVSRFMLQGLRLPNSDGGGTSALYEVTGQQIPFTHNGGGIKISVKCGQSGITWLNGENTEKFDGEQISEMLPDLNFTWANRFTIKPLEPFLLSSKVCPVREQVILGGRVLYLLNGNLSGFNKPVIRLDDSGEEVACGFGALLPFDIRQTQHDDIVRVIGLNPADREKLITVFNGNNYKLLYVPAPIDGKADTLEDLYVGTYDRFIK
jgi:hypothetical protein